MIKLRINKPNKMTLAIAVIVAALLALAGYFAYQYMDTKKEVERLSDPQVAAQEQTQELIAMVGKLADLPKGETPTIATVTDVSKLKSQPFFANAQNGDKVLIYSQAKKAYLYRPSTNKIIEIAPVNLGNDQGQGTATTPNQ